MKRAFLVIMALFLMTVINAQTVQPTSKKEALTSKESSFDFGKIAQGKPVTHDFEIVNSSDEVITIENVQASCGCTTPEWSRDPIPAGGSTKIKVGFNAAAFGKFDRAVTVIYGGGKVKQFHIKGDVWQAPADIAPANASIQLLKNTNK